MPLPHVLNIYDQCAGLKLFHRAFEQHPWGVLPRYMSLSYPPTTHGSTDALLTTRPSWRPPRSSTPASNPSPAADRFPGLEVRHAERPGHDLSHSFTRGIRHAHAYV